jgi:hypothetical protein
VPATDTRLDSFTFYVDLPTTLTFRGEVYRWDPTSGNHDPAGSPPTSGNATCPLGPGPTCLAPPAAVDKSGPMHTTSYDSTAGTYEPITFNTGGIALTPGAQYVLFFTISKDYAANAPTAGIPGFVAFTPTDTYSTGDWVYINNCGPGCPPTDSGGNTSLWTDPTNPWFLGVNYSNYPLLNASDLAFTASFSPPTPPLPTSKAQCKDGRWKTYGVFKNQDDCLRHVHRHQRQEPA